MANKRDASASQSGKTGMGTGPEKIKLNIIMLIITAAMGALAWFVGGIVYAAFSRILPKPILVGILFAILAVLTVFTVLIVSNIMGTYERNLFTGRVSDGIVLHLIAGIVGIFVLAALFQWLYGLNFTKKVEEPSSYIFVIDDSGSMKQNDPNNQRVSAIGTLLESKDKDFQYAIYTFADNVVLAKDMTKVSERSPDITAYSDGQTCMGAALLKVIDDVNSGVIDGGANPKVILLTDGEASDISYLESVNKYTNGYSNKGIVISTIGLGSANRSQLQSIADKTGGIFVSINDASQLNDAVSQAALGEDGRDLVSTRTQSPNDWIYGVMRVVFLTLLATAIGLCADYAYGVYDSFKITFIATVIKALLSALIVELGTAMLGALSFLPVLLASILTAATIAVFFVTERGIYHSGTTQKVGVGGKKTPTDLPPKSVV